MPTRIEDSTGKFIEATEDATEVLKGLVASLKGGVGKAKKIGKTGDSEDKLKDAVEKLPEEFVDELKKEFGNIGKMIQEVADFANMMTKKREKAIGLNNKDLNPMEKALATIKKSSTDTYKTFAKKGSGYTHDIYVEAAIKSLNGLVSNLTNILRSGVGSKRRKGKKGGGGSGNADYDMNQNVCVSALFVQDGKVLLVRRAIEPAKGKLDFMGGFVDPNESVEAAIKREAKEELGVEIEIIRLLGVYGPDPYPVGDVVVYNSAVTYLCRIVSGAPVPQDDVASLEWWSLEELPNPQEMAFPSQTQLIVLLRDGKLSLE
jgi:ADP-ribose pyrophosphatase YjhB (NUDIX family)